MITSKFVLNDICCYDGWVLFLLFYFNNTENITEHCSNADTTYQIETSGMYEI